MSDRHDDDHGAQVSIVTEVFERLMVKLRADPSRQPALRRAAEQVRALDTAAVRKGQRASTVSELVDRALELLAAPGLTSSPTDPFPSAGLPPPEIPGPFEQLLLGDSARTDKQRDVDLSASFSELLPVELGTVTEPADDPSGTFNAPEAAGDLDEPDPRRRRRTPALAFVAVFVVAGLAAAAGYVYVKRDQLSDMLPLLARNRDPAVFDLTTDVQPAAIPTTPPTSVVTSDPISPPATSAALPTVPAAVPTQPPPTAAPTPSPTSAPTPTPQATSVQTSPYDPTTPPVPATSIPPGVRARFRQSVAAPMVSADWQGRVPAWVIHFSSYGNRTSAERDARRLGDELGRPAYAATVDLGGKGVWHRVIVGGFATEDEALAFREELYQRRTPGLGHVYRIVAAP